MSQLERTPPVETEALLRVLVDIQERYIIEGISRGWWDLVVARVIELAGAEYGFVGRVAEIEGRPVLHSLGITNIAWNDWSRQVYETYKDVGLTFDNTSSLFGVTLVDEITVISNDPAHDPRSGGLPEGHPPLVTYVGIPLNDRSGMVGMLGLANRPGGFDEAFVEGLRPLTTFIGEIVGRDVLARANAETVALLAETEQVQRALYASNDLIVFVTDSTGAVTLANAAAVAAVGSSLTEGATLTTLFPNARDREWLEAAAGTGSSDRGDLQLRRDFGEHLSVRFTVRPVERADGEQNILFIGIDLSDRRALEESRILQARLAARVEQLETEERELRILSEAVDTALLSTDVEGVRVALGRALRGIYPDTCVSLYVPADETFTLDAAASDEGAPAVIDSGHCWALRSSRPHLSAPGQVLPECAHIEEGVAVCVPIDAAGERYGLVVIEIPPDVDRPNDLFRTSTATIVQRFAVVMAAVSLRESLRTLALTDDLTGLMNRSGFVAGVRRNLAQAARSRTPLAIVLLDLDDFKSINDRHGHAVGDETLIAVGAAVLGALREGDFCGRFGGDEFAIALPDTPIEGAIVLAERIRDSIAALEVRDVRLTASFGIAGCGEVAGSTWEDVYRAADRALYVAKDAGVGQIRTAG